MIYGKDRKVAMKIITFHETLEMGVNLKHNKHDTDRTIIYITSNYFIPDLGDKSK